jgi:ATP-dependent Clp protease protease subunit
MRNGYSQYDARSEDEHKKAKKRNDDDDDDDVPFFMMNSNNNKMLDKFTPTIYLNGQVNEAMARGFRDAIRELEYVRKSDIALIMINSNGGYVLDGYQILNAMKSSGLEFMTYCTSHAYSMGAAILSAGSPGKRFMAPLSHAMVHQVSAAAGGHIEEMRVEMKYLERMNRMVMDEVATNCNLTLEELEEKIRATGSTDLFLDPWEAKKLGLVDEVGRVNLLQARAYQLEVETVEAPKKAKKKKSPVKPSKVEVVKPKPKPKPKPATKPEKAPKTPEVPEKPKRPTRKPGKSS